MKALVSKKSKKDVKATDKVSNASKSISIKKLTIKEVEANRSSAYPYTF